MYVEESIMGIKIPIKKNVETQKTGLKLKKRANWKGERTTSEGEEATGIFRQT